MTRKHTFPAGSYFIGDPCYLIEDEDWDKIGDATNWFGAEFFPSTPPPPKDWDDGLYHWNGKPCFASHTKYGDGCYHNASGTHEFWVDSGLIGVTPFDDNAPPKDDLGFWMGGIIIDPKYSFDVWEEDGVFYIDRMIIRT
jgi:hypothetical protein